MKKRTKPPIFTIITLSTLIIVTLVTILVVFVLAGEYSKWSKDFEAGLNNEKVVEENNQILKKSVEEKITKFSKSNEKTDFIEISSQEFLFLLSESLNNTLPLGVKYEKGYIETEKGLWDVYIQTKINNITFPWLNFRMEKDATESAKVKISRMSIGNFDFTDYGAKRILERVNNGVEQSLELVNSSEFTGRVFQNIELEENSMIVKGVK